MSVTNPFVSADGAARYAGGRPYVHPLFMARLRPYLPGRALAADVACGTGLSSVALAGEVERVLAFDASAAMLAAAPAHPRVTYARALAEALPVGDGTLDALTVCQALHWFDRPAFLAEAARTLRPGGVLFVYDNFFLGEMDDEPNFTAWVRERYFARYPTPQRHSTPLDEAQVAAFGFSFVEERFRHPVPFTRAGLVAYLLTHSNTVTVTDAGRETTEAVRAWLTSELQAFSSGVEERSLQFGGLIWRSIRRA